MGDKYEPMKDNGARESPESHCADPACAELFEHYKTRLQALRIAARELAVKMGGVHEAETEGEFASLLMDFAQELHHAVNVSEGTTEPE